MKRYLVTTFLLVFPILIYSQDIYIIRDYNVSQDIFYNDKLVAKIKIVSIKDVTDLYDIKPFPQIVMIEYVYENIDLDSLRIGLLNFKVYDESKFIATAGDYAKPMTKFPADIPRGTSCVAQVLMGLENKSKYIAINYYMNLFMQTGNPLASFYLKVNQ